MEPPGTPPLFSDDVPLYLKGASMRFQQRVQKRGLEMNDKTRITILHMQILNVPVSESSKKKASKSEKKPEKKPGEEPEKKPEEEPEKQPEASF